MDVPTAGPALPLREQDRAHRCGRAAIRRATITLAAAAATGTTRGTPLILAAVWPTSVIFARVPPSASFLVAWAPFIAITTAFTVPVAIPITILFAVTAIWALTTVVSVSPATVPVPVPIAIPAMVLTRGAVTVRVTVMMVRAVYERERRKEVSTVLEIGLLVEGAPVDW